MKSLVTLAVVLSLLVLNTSDAKSTKKDLGFDDVWAFVTYSSASPTKIESRQDKVEKQDGRFAVTFAGRDHVQASFPVQPKAGPTSLAKGGVGRYDGFDSQRNVRYSVLHLENRSAAGFKDLSDLKVWEKLQERFDWLAEKGVKVTRKPSRAMSDSDRSTTYELTLTKGGKKTTLELDERVIVTFQGLTVADVITPQGGIMAEARRPGTYFLQTITVNPSEMPMQGWP